MESDRKHKLHDGKVGSAITVRVIPHAKHNQIKEILNDGTILVNLQDAGEDREINQSLINLLSQILGIKKSDIDIIGGEHGMDKLIALLNIDPDTVQTKLTK